MHANTARPHPAPEPDIRTLPEPEADTTDLYFNFADETHDALGHPLQGRGHLLTLLHSVGRVWETAFVTFWSTASTNVAQAAGIGDGLLVVEVMEGSGPSRVVAPAGSFQTNISETLPLANRGRIAVRVEELFDIDSAAETIWTWIVSGVLPEGRTTRGQVGFGEEMARGDRS